MVHWLDTLGSVLISAVGLSVNELTDDGETDEKVPRLGFFVVESASIGTLVRLGDGRQQQAGRGSLSHHLRRQRRLGRRVRRPLERGALAQHRVRRPMAASSDFRVATVHAGIPQKETTSP